MSERSATSRPPRIALWLLETFLPAESRDAVIGDLVEAHTESGAGIRARLRFWREALAALFQLQLTPEHVAAFTPYQRESPMQSIVSDIRQGARTLRRARGFTLLCVVTLGVAIGATAAIYSAVNPVLIRSLPYPDPYRLQLVYERGRDGLPDNVGYATYLDLRRSATTIEHAAAVGSWQPTLFGDRDAERVPGQSVTWEYFRTLGVRPAIGRDFDAADDTPDTRNVVILGHGLWVRRFGADSSIVGKTINTGTVKSRVVGVMPASFQNVLGVSAEIWRPLGYAVSQPWACRSCRHLRMVVRVRQGVPIARADREMNTLLAALVAQFPREYGSVGAITYGVQAYVTRNARPVMLALFGAALLVLLIAAANVINLQLARAIRRNDEFAIRAALGAGRGRIARQLVGEGMVLALLSAVTGVAIAWVSLPILIARLPSGLPRIGDIRLDWRVLLFVSAVSLVAGVLVGLVPAINTGTGMLSSLRTGGSARSVGVSRHRIRKGLVILEIALALTLVVATALLGRSLARLLDVNPGLDPAHVLTMVVQASGPAYDSDQKVFANHDRVVQAVRALPGVVDAGIASQLPLMGDIDRYGVQARDKPLANPELAPSADRYAVSAGFLRTMRIPILEGRAFTEAEAASANGDAAVVSRALARRIWPGESAVGKYIHMGEPSRPWKRVVGVAGDVRHEGLDVDLTQQVYVPERQWFWSENLVYLVVRTAGDPDAMATAVYNAVRGVDPLQPITNVQTMEQVVSGSTAHRRLGLLLFGVFGGIALVLASAGIYGVLAGLVQERTREIGVRVAIGASPSAITTLVLRQAGQLTLAGLVIGGVAAVLTSRYLHALLFGIAPSDPIAVTSAALVIVAVSLGACVIPVRRAVRVDPMTALRAE